MQTHHRLSHINTYTKQEQHKNRPTIVAVWTISLDYKIGTTADTP